MIVFLRFAFQREQRNRYRGGFLMIPTDIEISIGTDRLATWNEVHSALLSSSRPEFAPVDVCDDSTDMNYYFNDCDSTVPEDSLWLAIIGEMPPSQGN
jgi:hypothetical protein